MKKIIALLVLALLGFYVAWPAWSGYRLATALGDGNEALLAAKVDFPAVRESLRPTVTTEVEKNIQKQAGQGLGNLLSGDFKAQLVPKMVDLVLEKVVTPGNVIRIAKEGGNVAGSVEKILMEEMNKAGGIPGLPKLPGGGSGSGGLSLPGGMGGALGGLGAAGSQLGIPGFPGGSQPKATAPPPAAATPTATGNQKPSYGLANVKSFGLDGPLGYRVAVAKDPAGTKPDVTAGMRFTGFDWKLTSLVPNL
jgi:Protein of unknown function (DUF2939)